MSADSLHFRLATVLDLTRLHVSSLHDPGWMPPTDAASPLPPGCRLIVAESSDGEICAWMALQIVLDEAEILNIVVAPSYRRRGVGAALLHRAWDECMHAAVGAVFLEVRASNSAAQALYRKQGFQDCGCRKAYYPALPGADDSGREDARIMRKNLT